MGFVHVLNNFFRVQNILYVYQILYSYKTLFTCKNVFWTRTRTQPYCMCTKGVYPLKMCCTHTESLCMGTKYVVRVQNVMCSYKGVLYAYIIFYLRTKSCVRVQNSLYTYKIVCMSTISYGRVHMFVCVVILCVHSLGKGARELVTAVVKPNAPKASKHYLIAYI